MDLFQLLKTHAVIVVFVSFQSNLCALAQTSKSARSFAQLLAKMYLEKTLLSPLSPWRDSSLLRSTLVQRPGQRVKIVHCLRLAAIGDELATAREKKLYTTSLRVLRVMAKKPRRPRLAKKAAIMSRIHKLLWEGNLCMRCRTPTTRAIFLKGWRFGGHRLCQTCTELAGPCQLVTKQEAVFELVNQHHYSRAEAERAVQRLDYHRGSNRSHLVSIEHALEALRSSPRLEHFGFTVGSCRN